MFFHMNNKTIYYGIANNNTEKEAIIEVFKAHGATEENIVIDNAMVEKDNRPGYTALEHELLGLQRGDTLVIRDKRALGDTNSSASKAMKYWRERGVYVMSCSTPASMREIPSDKEGVRMLIMDILIENAETYIKDKHERTRRRQQEGINAMPVVDGKKVSPKTGNPAGRPRAEYPAKWNRYYTAWKEGTITATECMKLAGVKKNTFYNLVKKYESEKE